MGLVFGPFFLHPFGKEAARFSRVLLQASVVGLGFGMNLHAVARAGRTGFIYTLLSISFAMIFGILLGKVLRVEHTSAYLISTGTAICGGSAIAAVGSFTGASDEEDGSFSGYGIRLIRGVTDFSSDRSGVEAEPDAVWLVGRAGDP